MPADAPAMALVAERAMATYAGWAGPEWRPEGIDHLRADCELHLGAEGSVFLVAEESGAVVGTGGFVPARDPHEVGPLVPGTAHMTLVMVEPEHWGRGVASAIVAALVAEMRERAYERVQLWTPPANERARRFYERRGWAEVGRHTTPGGLEIARFVRDLARNNHAEPPGRVIPPGGGRTAT